MPGSTSTTDSVGPWINTTSPAMYLDIVTGNAGAPGTVDETTYTGVGDSGGQFAVADGKHKYNLINASAPLGSAGTYYVYMNSSTALGNANRVPTTNAPNNIASFGSQVTLTQAEARPRSGPPPGHVHQPPANAREAGEL